MRRTLLASRAAFLLALLGALSLAGCSAGSGSSAGSAGSGGSARSAVAPAPPGVTAQDSAGAPMTSGGSVATANRDVVVTGSVTITADDPIAAARAAVGIVEGAGGRIDARTEYAPTTGDAGRATLVLRIPAAKLTVTLDQLTKLGRADQVSTSSSDVTADTRDLAARIDALRASIGRLTTLMSTATKTEDLITLESAISDRQSQLESLGSQQKVLADQVAMSTITLQLQSTTQAPKVVPGDFFTGLSTGWNAFVAFWAGLLVALGVLLPWIVTAAVIAFGTIRLVRWRRGRRPIPPAG